jgi:hypothetical protein
LVTRQWNGTIWQNLSGGGGGGGSPGGLNTQVQFNNLGNFGGITNAASGSQFVSQGTSTTPTFQTKPLYDMRDYGLAQDGTTDDTAATINVLNTIGASNNADVLFTGPTALEPVVFNKNVTIRMQQQGALKPISTSTSPGGAGFVQGSGSSNVNTLTSSCSVTLSGTVATHSLIFMENHSFTGAVIAVGTVTDTQNGYYRQLVQQGFNFTSVNTAWGHGNIPGGNVTITVQYLDNIGNPKNVANGCIAWEISGMGPVIGTDAAATSPESNLGSLVMSAGAINTTTGALVIGFGGQSYLNQSSCTPAAGFTQPAGTAGFISGGSQPSTGYGFNLCATYKLSSPGGNQTPTSTISNDPLNLPLNRYWAYAAVSVIPASSIVTIQGPLDAGAKQIFTNALPGQGTIDFTGNTSIDKVFPEWWGACGTCTATNNTNGIQAAVNAAYGTNRINGSQANQYNRELHLSAMYNINGTITPLHLNGAHWTCSQRFACGFNQTAANTSILTTTSAGTYWDLDDILFQTTASQDLNHPLVDLNFTATPGSDLISQFIDFHRDTFNGNKLAAIGLRGSAAGGGAQYSNINHYNNLWESFTEAGYMIGNGSGCTPSTLATNALAINIFNGDFQGNNAYGIEWFGAGAIEVISTSFENGFGAATNFGIQTGADICGRIGAGGDQFVVSDMRSESKVMFGGGGPYDVSNSWNIDQAIVPGQGATVVTNEEFQGSVTGGHGVYYTVTAGGSWQGIGGQGFPFWATSGTSTTLTNTNQLVTGAVTSAFPNNACLRGETMTQTGTGSTATLLNTTTGTNSMQITPATGSPNSSGIWNGGTSSCAFTPTAAPVAASNLSTNAWVGFYLSIVNGTGQYQYCTITANTATQITCSGGWQTDFPDYVSSFSNPDNSSQYIIEPAWGTQFSNNGITWAADTSQNTGIGSAYNVFFAGLQMSFGSFEPLVDRLQVTRSDWYGGGGDADNLQIWAQNGVTAGTLGLATGTGGAGIATLPWRRYKNPRNGITEIPLAQPNDKGTSTDHWWSGLVGGGTATGDTYWGLNSNVGAGTKKGFQYLTNNSSGSAQTWQWNSDGSSSAPGTFTTAGQLTSTISTGTAPLSVSSTTPVATLVVTKHPQVQACGTVAACSATAMTGAQIVQGSAALASGTPSTVTITGISPAFTSTSTYNCMVADQTAGSALFYTKVSGSSITITGPNTVTDTVSFICAGN